MARRRESDHPVKNKMVWLLIRGCTNPSQNIDFAKKKKTGNGNYLQGMAKDMANMEAFIHQQHFYHFHNAVSSNNLTINGVINEIKATCQYAKTNGATDVTIYYTGHGEKHSGNWCFSDGVLRLAQSIDVMMLFRKLGS